MDWRIGITDGTKGLMPHFSVERWLNILRRREKYLLTPNIFGRCTILRTNRTYMAIRMAL